MGCIYNCAAEAAGIDWPAWVQAIGSIGALLLAIYVPVRIRTADRYDQISSAVDAIVQLHDMYENMLFKPIALGAFSVQAPPHPQLQVIIDKLKLYTTNITLPLHILQFTSSAATTGQTLHDAWSSASRTGDTKRFIALLNMSGAHLSITKGAVTSSLKTYRRKHRLALLLY